MLREEIFYNCGLPVNVLVANIREYPIHFHSDIEVAYVLSGKVSLKNGCSTHTLNKGDIYILNDKELHSYDSGGADNMVLLLQLDISYFSNYYEDFRNCFFIADINCENDGSLEILRGILARIMMEVMQKRYAFEHRVIECAHNLISYLMSDFRHFLMEDGKFVNGIRRKGNKTLADRMHRITDYLYENYPRKLTLEEVAATERLSTFYLSHAIKEATGLSFQDLLSFIRVEESEKLLLGTNKKISLVADECGFSAVRYYMKHFYKWFGMAPSEYRKKYRGKVIGRETMADYEQCGTAAIEEAVRSQMKGIYKEYVGEDAPEPKIFNIDIHDCMAGKRQKSGFPEELFEKEEMKVAARPFNLFKNLNEQIFFASGLCMVSTSALSCSNVSNLSVLIYNFDDDFHEKLTAAGRDGLIERLKACDKESEVLIRCIGISGNFRITRYKMTRQNVISACEEGARAPGALNKRQALLNSWGTLPNIETGEIAVSDTLSLRSTLRGFSAELILIDRK